MNNKKNCFIMGYPSTGKTTFLTALWYVVSNGNIIDNSPIKLNNMGESSYLSSLLTSWIKAEPLIRTSLENENRNISIESDMKVIGLTKEVLKLEIDKTLLIKDLIIFM